MSYLPVLTTLKGFQESKKDKETSDGQKIKKKKNTTKLSNFAGKHEMLSSITLVQQSYIIFHAIIRSRKLKKKNYLSMAVCKGTNLGLQFP